MINKGLIVCLALIPFYCFAQKDSIQNEILKYNDPKTEIIKKGRLLLLNKFEEGDIDKVKELKNYLLTEAEDKNYLALYVYESWLLDYWTHEYNTVIYQISRIDSIVSALKKERIKPPQDLLMARMREKTRNSISEIKFAIDKSDQFPIYKDLLNLNLNYLLYTKDYPTITTDSLNAQSDIFLSRYPNSPYNPYIRHYIRHKYIPSKWGFDFEFFSGYSAFTDDLHKSFSGGVPIGIAFDIYYKKFSLSLRDYIGFSSTKKDLSYDGGIWRKNSAATIFLPEASIGYVIKENKIYKVIPFAGIASTSISPTTADIKQTSSLNDAGLDFTTTYVLGASFDLKMGKSRKPIVSRTEQNYWFLRCRYSYNLPQFNKSYPGYAGAMHLVTIGIGAFGRKVKRDY